MLTAAVGSGVAKWDADETEVDVKKISDLSASKVKVKELQKTCDAYAAKANALGTNLKNIHDEIMSTFFTIGGGNATQVEVDTFFAACKNAASVAIGISNNKTFGKGAVITSDASAAAEGVKAIATFTTLLEGVAQKTESSKTTLDTQFKD